MEKYCTAGLDTDDNIKWRMRFTCWVPKATNTLSEYCNRWQQRVVVCQPAKHLSSRLPVRQTLPARDAERYSVILSVLDPRKCEYLKDYSLDFEHAYMTTYLAS